MKIKKETKTEKELEKIRIGKLFEDCCDYLDNCSIVKLVELYNFTHKEKITIDQIIRDNP